MPDLDDLMAAVVSGNLPEVLSILDAPGAAPAIFDGQENTVIWMACAHALNAGPHANLEREGIVNALLRAGAPPNPLSLGRLRRRLVGVGCGGSPPWSRLVSSRVLRYPSSSVALSYTRAAAAAYPSGISNFQSQSCQGDHRRPSEAREGAILPR